MIFNCLREDVIWWTVAVILAAIVTAAFGALAGAVYVLWRGYNLYSSRFDWDGNVVDPEEMAKAKAKAERQQAEDEKKAKMGAQEKKFDLFSKFSGKTNKPQEPPKSTYDAGFEAGRRHFSKP